MPQHQDYMRARDAAAKIDQAQDASWQSTDPWRNAVYDACTVAHIGWDSGDPRKTIEALISWHVAMALDPAVSGAPIVARVRELEEELAKAHAIIGEDVVQGRIDLREIAMLTLERNQARSERDDLANRNAILRARPDLPVDRLPAHSELARLQEENAQLKHQAAEREQEDADEADGMMIVTKAVERVANALKGQPEPLRRHSWHDLGELTEALVAQRDQLKADMAAISERAERLAVKIGQLSMVASMNEHHRTGTLRLNIIEDDTLEPGQMIVGDGRTSLVLTNITPEHIEAIAADRMTEFKADDIVKRGYNKVGYVLMNAAGDYSIVAQSAVRWMSKLAMWTLMHAQPEPAA
jgi:hypothetical protein